MRLIVYLWCMDMRKAMAMGVVALGLAGCARTVYVPVERTTVRTDTLVRRVVQRDSVRITDSVAVTVRGDTLRVEHWRDRWRDRTVTDTLYKVRTDTVRVRETVPAAQRPGVFSGMQKYFDRAILGIFALVLLLVAVKRLIKH